MSRNRSAILLKAGECVHTPTSYRNITAKVLKVAVQSYLESRDAILIDKNEAIIRP